MIIQNRIRRLQVDRLFKRLSRFLVLSQLVVSPAEAIDDIAVVRLQLHGSAEHLERLFQIEPFVDPGIAEIVQDQRLIRIELQRLLEIRLGLRPLIRSLVTNPAEIEQRPVLALRYRDGRDRPVVGRRRLCVFLGGPLQLGQCAQGFDVMRPRRYEFASGASWPRRSFPCYRVRARSGCRRPVSAATRPAPSGRRR